MSENYDLQPDANSQTVRNTDSYNLDTRNTRKIINEIRASFGAPPTTMTDEQIEAGREVYGAKLDYDMAVIDEVQDTREHMDNGVSVRMCPNGHPKNLARHSKASQVFSDGFSDGQNKHETVRQDELSDTREQLEEDVKEWCATYPTWNHANEFREHVFEWLDRQAAITRRETRQNWQDAPNVLDRSNLQTIAELTAELETYRKYADQGKCDNCGTAENGDTREQLERCLRGLLGLRVDEEPDPTTSGIYYNIIGLLDRQAAITERECCEKWPGRANVDKLERRLKLAEEQRDRESAGCREYIHKLAELTDEVDNLRKRNDNQADTIRRLRAEFDAALDDLARAVEDKRSHPF